MDLEPDSWDALLQCALCGVKVQPQGPWRAEAQWTARAELLSDPDEEFEAREVHYRAGKRPGVPPFAAPKGPPAAIRRDAAVVVADGREVHSEWAARFDANHVPLLQPYSIAVHAACMDIAARVVRRPRPGVRVRSLRTLWKVLRTRLDARDNELMGSVDVPGRSLPVHAQNYYLTGHYFGPPWTRELPSPLFAMADPLNVPELTSQLLHNLRPMDGRRPSEVEKAFQTRFRNLPPELREKVVSFMLGPDGLPGACTRLLRPSVWRDILLEPKLLPFLWDVDADLVRAYDAERRSLGIVPDWEELVRKLSLGVGFGKGGFWDQYVDHGGGWTLDVADGLRNRRRIWQLAEEMYVGDQLLCHCRDNQSPITMPKYWDEDGEPLHPVRRVLCQNARPPEWTRRGAGEIRL